MSRVIICQICQSTDLEEDGIVDVRVIVCNDLVLVVIVVLCFFLM